MSRFDPGLVAVEQRLAHADHRAGDHDLVAHLGVLARPRPALIENPLAHRLEQRHQAVDGRLVAADHDRQRRVARADVAARDRRIHGVGALRPRRLVDLLRQRRFGRRHVDEDLTGARGREQSVGAEIDLAHVGREADDGEHDIGLVADRLRRVGPGRAVLDQAEGFFLRSRADDDRVALVQDVAAHRSAHDTGPDPADAWQRLW